MITHNCVPMLTRGKVSMHVENGCQSETKCQVLLITRDISIYFIEGDKIIIVEMFDKREDFIYKLFVISTILQEYGDY